MKIDPHTQVDIDVEPLYATLSVDEAWPDGPPEKITAEAFAREIRKQHPNVRRFLEDWNLLDDVKVTITIRNNSEQHAESAILYE